MTTLRQAVTRVLIVAHHEDTTDLRRTLAGEGFVVEEIRGPYTSEQGNWSLAMRCLANQANAWRRCVEIGEDVIVCEADFVPVVRFGSLPLPCPRPTRKSPGRIAWLYCAGSILYGVDRHGFMFGHGQTSVCWYLSVDCARSLLEFFVREVARTEPREYVPWDTYVGHFLETEKRVCGYFVDRQYGEHGGVSNPEHAQQGLRSWHRAELLARPLAFTPAYAKGSRWSLLRLRLLARVRGVARLLALRYFDPRKIAAGQSPMRLGALAVKRLVFAFLPF